jgi:hypothetical protein
MWNSYDLDQVSRLFVRDDRLTYLSSEKEGVLRGFETVMAHHRGFGFVEGGKTSPNRLWLDGLEYSEFGNGGAGAAAAVVVAGTWFFQRGADGPVQRGPVTFVCVHDSGDAQGAGYRLAHLNFGNYPARK